jgi:hypothetical protein
MTKLIDSASDIVSPVYPLKKVKVIWNDLFHLEDKGAESISRTQD